MQIIFQQLFVLYIFLIIGYGIGKGKPQLQPHTGLLSFLLVNLCLPSKVFGAFANHFTVPYLQQHRSTVLISLTLLSFLIVVSYFFAKCCSDDQQLRKLYRYSLTISNYAYVGYALAEGIFGSLVLTDLIMFCFPFIVYANGFGYVMFTGDRFSAKRLINPAVIAILCGAVFGLSDLSVPFFIQPILSFCSSCMGPLGMLMTGMVLAGFSWRYLLGNTFAYTMVALRLAVIPACIFGIFWLCGADRVLIPAVLMACMPFPINPILLSRMTGRDCSDAARLILLSLIFSCLTLPCWLWVLQQI